jgi:hypothetical protein
MLPEASACPSAANRSERGTGSLRERSLGVREVRVVVGFDPARRRSIQRSFTVHGDAALACAPIGGSRSYACSRLVTLGERLPGGFPVRCKIQEGSCDPRAGDDRAE